MILSTEALAKDIDRSVFPALQGGPLMHVIAAKAVAFHQAMSPEFKADAERTVENARALGAALTGHGATLMTGGTDTHLMLVDVTPFGVTGKEADQALGEVDITVNKNAIPFDPNPPMVASGIRIGTPCVTGRGMGPAEMAEIGELIVAGIAARGDAEAQADVRRRVVALAERFPVPGLAWTRG
jgi:glycine hydroxymethyltransferase